MIEHTLENWIKSIEKELPLDQKYTSLSFNKDMYVSSGIEIDHQSEAIHPLTTSHGWNILSISSKNEYLLESLKLGAEAIFVMVSEADNIDEILNSVELSFLKSIIVCKDDSSYEKTLNYLNKMYTSQNLVCTLINQSELICIENFTTESFTSAFKKAQLSIRENKNTLVYQLHFTNDFFRNIASLRAIRIIHENISAAYNVKVSYSIVALPTNSTKPIDQLLIERSIAAVSCVIGNADFICLAPWSEAYNDCRLQQNVLHLLRAEAKMDIKFDGAAGSFFIENITNQICINTLTSLKNQS